ncbi:MAG TPA: magnesium transporter CorA family protein [Nitrososphaeraceae archaeon]|jgi:magnesium transporter
MTKIEYSDQLDSIINKNLIWIDIQKPTRKKLKILEGKYPFHELNIEDSLSKKQIPKIDKYQDHIFVILHFPTMDEDSSIRSTQLAIFAGPNYLITVQQGELKPLIERFNLCKDSEKEKEIFMGSSSGYLLHSIIDLMVDDLLHVLMKLEGNLDDIEDLVFDEKVAIARDISLLRREITTLRRVVVPLSRIILELSKEMQRFSEEDLTDYYDDVRDHTDKVLEVLEESKETIEIFKDTDFMLSTEKSNKILSLLTILFTLSIPATVIGTYYGMNINLPGGIITGSPDFLGPYTSFIILLTIAIVPSLVMVWYFKKLGWFGWYNKKIKF